MMGFIDTLLSNRIRRHLELGKNYKTISALFDTVVRSSLPSTAAIVGWHELLIRYIEDPRAVLFVRLYRDDKKDASLPREERYPRNRGGFLTEVANGYRYVFTDNSLAQAIYVLAMNGIVPKYDEWIDAVQSRSLPVLFKSVASERQLQAYAHDGKLDPGLNAANFKLCHIIPVGKGVDGLTWREIFPRGERADWIIRAGIPVRSLPATTSEVRSRMLAHFIRYVHPANHFLAPKVKCQTSRFEDIGEEPALLRVVHHHRHAQLPELHSWLDAAMGHYDVGEWPSFSDASALSIDLTTHAPKALTRQTDRNVARLVASPSDTTTMVTTDSANGLSRVPGGNTRPRDHGGSALTGTPSVVTLDEERVVAWKATRLHFKARALEILRSDGAISGVKIEIEPTESSARNGYVSGYYYFSREQGIRLMEEKETTKAWTRDGWHAPSPPDKYARWFHPRRERAA